MSTKWQPYPLAAEHAAQLRAAKAELYILETFNRHRRLLGHDYGCGQRHAELNRRESEIDRTSEWRGRELDGEDVDFNGEDLREAWSRVAAPRKRRIELESYRHTPATQRTLQAWERTWNTVLARISEVS